ncbi:D-alanine--D-alanine ligase family protein [Pseudoclavibacter helvolus]|uniref:D-alanine--D-alanine ligase family protein n=1 Tax=Pseudoclavibacter helvolus TaxID=255205 RepID=UPI000837DF87|nr:D-alanine--D-alanine ligase [Pseudoclavibacter helvolus]
MSIEGLHVVILSGGISHERDVSLRSGRRVADALSRAGADVTIREPDASLLGFLEEAKPDVVWPLLHGSSGENGALYSLLRAGRFPYVGSRPTSARLAWNKATAKALAKRAGLSTPPSIVLENSTFRELGAEAVMRLIARGIELPAVVKPVEGGSAQGVSSVSTFEELPQALVTAFTYDDTVIIEKRVEGREVMVGVLDLDGEPLALPAVEVVANKGVYDYEARYNAGETTYYAPARLSDDEAARVNEAALHAVATIGLSDIARVDFIVDEAGVVWFLEADPIPGLTETSIVPLGIEADDSELSTIYAQLAAAAAARGPLE